ncbi:rho guanine nucleotide exchange factor 12-like isoform X3 [Physella acuta]|uniref:rho guanine nucleotide exchange factor 12-like isoform X3 n=1 Tax=Physella acuta TaxID=109671 RepID=UPI0027DC914A|nr:rho guanine nucleotide exchange factor 12-like isoform X3 [Physella acuta]
MPLNRKWRSMDLFGSKENLSKGHVNKEEHMTKGLDGGKADHSISLRDKGENLRHLKHRLTSIVSRGDEPSTPTAVPPDSTGANLVQRCVIIQRDEKGYGFTVSGDNPVFVASVKADGAASKAGVQHGDRIVKVNGTLVTSRNHLDVVKLIKSGSYVALTLLGKPHPSGPVLLNSATPSNPDPAKSRVTAPQPVDPDKDREVKQQKISMTRAMFETAKEDFDKLQRQYVSKPSEKLHSLLLEKERTVKTLENQLKQLTGGDEATTPSGLVPMSNRFSDIEHGADHPWMSSSPSNIKHTKQSSVPMLNYKSMDTGQSEIRPVARSKSDAATRKVKTTSTFYVGFQGTNDSEASSVPTTTSDLGSMSDSPQTSPSISPTPNDPHSRHNGQEMEDSMMTGSQDIITIDDEDVHSDDDQLLELPLIVGGRPTSPFLVKITSPEANDPGPFADIKLLESKPAHMAIFLNYLISNSDPSPVLFHIISDQFSRSTASKNELRKWAYEIYSTFVAQTAPLCISVEDNLISQIDNILTTSATKTDNESVLKTMFQASRLSVQNEINELLSDFRSKKDLGMLNFYGGQKLHENMDRAAEIKTAEELLIPILESLGPDDNARPEKDQATAWALATFLRLWVGSKSNHNATLERVQTFMMKDKRSIKVFGSKSSRAKDVKGHQFNLQHFCLTTNCNFCGGLLWGVGCQGFQCQSCKMTLHKQCIEEITEVCGGKPKKRGSTAVKLINAIPNRRISYNQPVAHIEPPPRPGSEINTAATTQPYPKEDNSELASVLSLIAGLPVGHSVSSLVNRYELSPTGPGPGAALAKLETGDRERKGSSDLNRTGSLNNKGEKGDRPTRRAKSDVDVNPETFKALSQSGSSSASSISNRSIESPSNSTDRINDVSRLVHDDSDLDVDTELPSLKSVLGEENLRKLKPKEKKRQEVINELFYTERTHLRNLKIIDLLFNRPMLQEQGVIADLARALFPTMNELISLHETVTKDMKERVKINPVVKDVGDLLLKRFDGQAGEWFRKICAEYCRNQAFALDFLKKQTRKEPKLQQFLNDAESNPLCRRLQLKDLVPSQMQRLTKYPLLIDNLLKYTQSPSEEYKKLERALERCKHILAYVNQAVKECENFHKLKDIQKKLDKRALDTSTDPALAELKNLDLTKGRLIFDGPLTWKLRSHRTVDLHVLLFDDMLVLLQKQDDRYVLKCQSTNVQSARDEHKYTHSPVLRLQNLLARSLATDKKSFFVVNISEVRAQMYEFTAATSDLRIKWCKLINDKAEELKKTGTAVRPNLIQPEQGDKAAERESDITSQMTEEDQVDSLSHLEDLVSNNEELIQPDEVHVSNPLTSGPLNSPLELLHQNAQNIDLALQERERLLAQVLKLSWNPAINQKPGDTGGGEEEEVGRTGEFLLARAFEINNRCIQLVNSASLVLAHQQPMDDESPLSPSRPLSTISQGENWVPEAESASNGVSIQRQQSLPPAQIVQQSSLSVPVPMEQLKEMAAEMNTILTRLMSTMNTGSEERHKLRQELQEAQQKLDALKEMQRQISSGPSERLSPLSPSRHIPKETITKETLTKETITKETITETTETLQEEEVMTSETCSSLNVAQSQVLEDRQEEEIVHHEVQEVARLEESVEALNLSSETSEIMTQARESSHTKIGVYDEDDDDDDGSNEVSVAGLPLPDIQTIPDTELHNTSQQSDAAEESDTESDDNDTLTSKNSFPDFPSLSTTVEDTAGEEREGGDREEGEEKTLIKQTELDTEIITGGSSVDKPS